jgi:hypothetical protein
MKILNNALFEYCKELSITELYDETEGVHYWNIPCLRRNRTYTVQSGVCTDSARLIPNKFGGKVFGYLMQDNPKAVIGHDCFGHDFALVGTYLVDFWAWHVDGSIKFPMFSLIKDAVLIKSLYGDSDCWKEVVKTSYD